MKLIVGISGATGVLMGYRLMQALKETASCEIHLVVSEAARHTWDLEVDRPIEELYRLADVVHSPQDLAASISSGSFRTDGMIVLPCSMKTLAGITSGYTDNLLLRAVDVCLKENRRVVLCPREMPMNRIHLKNMLTAAEVGCTIVPPMLTFYNGSSSLEEQVDHIIGKILMQFGLDYPRFKAWTAP